MSGVAGVKSTEKVEAPVQVEVETSTWEQSHLGGPDVGLQRLARHAAAQAGDGAGAGPDDRSSPDGALTAERIIALQRSAGNAAVARYMRAGRQPVAQRLFGKREVDTFNVSSMEALRLKREERSRGPMRPGVRGWMRGGMSEEDHEAVDEHLDEEGIDEDAPSPLAEHRDLMPTSKDVGMEVVKPALLGGASGAGYLGGQAGLHTSSGAASQSISSGGSIGGEIFGAGMLADSALTLWNGSKQRDAAAQRGDHAGKRLGSRKVNAGALALGAGAIGVTATGMKLGSALGSHAAGLTTGAGALGIAGGAVGMAQGLWRMNAARKRYAAVGQITPSSAEGQRWKAHIRSQEMGRGGVNAAKFAAGGLATAAGGLLTAGMGQAGFAVGMAGLALGGVLALGKLGSKISDMWKQRKAKRAMEKEGSLDSTLEEQSPEEQAEDPGRRKEVHGHADTMQASQSKNASIASELIAAMRGGNKQRVIEARDVQAKLRLSGDHTFKRVNEYWAGKAKPRSEQIGDPERRLHDAWRLLVALNVSPEEALSESGQDLIQKKLSVAESV